MTVSLSDQSNYGYITAGQSAALPSGMTVRYRSGHPDVVTVSQHGSVLSAASAGVATVTATVTYHGRSASGSFVVCVQ